MYVASLDDPELRPADAHHLGRVLRLRAGEDVVAAAEDGSGAWRRCTWAKGRLAGSGPVVGADGPRPAEIAVGFVPTKGDRPEWVVHKLTELGVDRIVVASSARSVVRWDDERGTRHLSKLLEVSRQAGMQSRRVALPVIEGVVPFARLVAAEEWAMAVPGGGPLAGAETSGGALRVLVGPEGGWSEEEERGGPAAVGLGPGVLRAETAAVAAGTVLMALRAGVVGLPGPAV